jgi:hypothetical protein
MTTFNDSKIRMVAWSSFSAVLPRTAAANPKQAVRTREIEQENTAPGI